MKDNDIQCRTCRHLLHGCKGPSGRGSHDECAYFKDRPCRFINTEAPKLRPRWCPRVYDRQ